MKLNEENVNFIHTTNIQEENFSSLKLSLALIPSSNNSQINVRIVVKIFLLGNLRGEVTILLSNLRISIEEMKAR